MAVAEVVQGYVAEDREKKAVLAGCEELEETGVVAADVVETDCVVTQKEKMVGVAWAVLVASADELEGRAVVVAFCVVLGGAGVLVVLVDEETLAEEVMGFVVVDVEETVGKIVETGVVVADVVASA
ncbi:hypothetical protein P7K49_006440 [Saguinus oedipus]|uniref:Uncharacterized protein n=1 Tax=Saguinus oedipus TaxID=9490 RepID=A0ABQ9W2F1_SAGOE|nr:hypothetical protein P7K49_006440 [Saguinus oedipus]